MADGESRLDAQIGRLLRVTRADDYHASADAREQADFQRLRSLSVATTSGDTLVRVAFPAGHFVDCGGYKWATKEFLMNSRQLLATGSSVFEKLLSPEAQEHAKRHFSYSSGTHPGTEYVLDLTPPIVEDESASLVAKLSLRSSVRNWWRAYLVLRVSKYLVSGHDDVCPQHVEVLLSDFEADGGVDRKGNDVVDIGELGSPISREIEDYCPIRHRAALLRLLMAISYGDLILNSAPRTATMAVIAQHYDCRGVVNDSALIWFMEETNQNFIDINAEDAVEIAWELELSAVARVAFRVLVVERALDILDSDPARSRNTDLWRRPSVFGRPRVAVPDEQETCIQHAAQRLAQRASDLWARLLSEDAHALLEIGAWPRHNPALCAELRAHMSDVLQRAMYRNVNFDFDMRAYDRNRSRYAAKSDLVATKDIYQRLSPAQRILTCSFWRSFGELTNSDQIWNNQNMSFYSAGSSSAAESGGFDPYVFKNEFATAAVRLGAQWAFPELEVNILQTGPLALGLSDDEFKFLPLWAGGLADETGAVYQSDIPDAVRGAPIGPGPSFRTGDTIAESDDSFSAFSGDDETATVATGTDTDSMTMGYSVHAEQSQMTSTDDDSEAGGGGGWTATIPVISLARGTSASRDVPPTAAAPAARRRPTPREDFDWLHDDSDDMDLDRLHDSDFDFDSDETEQADDANNCRGAPDHGHQQSSA
ncbi:hypothetical protein SAMD00023353_2400140 [Rosellinia necatrix]|uniref:Uncharacterized protein n=1 Tax=Rosellinia necatrix TaxID=77044 RepID=A0A1W2TFN6_ROSNE|nr:hypothetical protein SAMD00023353_2400140 [Rosellinia necatrix]